MDDDIIRMAREAGWKDLPTVRLAFAGFDLSYFANLVRADERKRIKAEPAGTRALIEESEPVEPVACPACEELGYVPLSEDGRSVFIDGVGEVPLAQQAEPVEPVEPVAWEGWWLHHGQHNYRAKPLTSERVKDLMKLAFEVGRESAPPQRKPLTSDKDRPDQGATYVEGYGYVDTRAVRAIERAHDITDLEGGNHSFS